MQLRIDALETHLAKTLAPLYVITSDEHLLALEAADKIRKSARAQGFSERDVLSVDRSFKWGELLAANQSQSLFGDKKMIETHLKKYNLVLFEKGFNFQEQFEVTKEIDVLLKNDLKIWNTYLTLLGKIDQLTKENTLYKKYNQIYPSPELQINWLKPKNTIL